MAVFLCGDSYIRCTLAGFLALVSRGKDSPRNGKAGGIARFPGRIIVIVSQL